MAGYRSSTRSYKKTPRTSRSVNSIVRSEKAGIDVVPRMITCSYRAADAPVTSIADVTGLTDWPCAFNAQYQLYTNALFVTQKALYKEYRLKQCKLHIMLQGVTGDAAVHWVDAEPWHLSYAWQRTAKYEKTAGQAIATLCAQPNCIQKVWPASSTNLDFWTTITAGSANGEGNWLNTAYAPGTAPNLGMCFQPVCFYNLDMLSAPADGTLRWAIEAEFVVEFRGSLV